MSDEPDKDRRSSNDDDDARTEEAKRVAKEYAQALREALRKFRKWFS